jgi:hypothetical protein
LKWLKVQDAKDAGKTKIQVFTKQGSSGDPNVPLFAEPLPTLDSATIFSTETIGTDSYTVCKFKKTFSGVGSWKVVLRDARGTETVAPQVAPFSAFVAP